VAWGAAILVVAASPVAVFVNAPARHRG
jgi:hypothetical protein